MALMLDAAFDAPLPRPRGASTPRNLLARGRLSSPGEFPLEGRVGLLAPVEGAVRVCTEASAAQVRCEEVLHLTGSDPTLRLEPNGAGPASLVFFLVAPGFFGEMLEALDLHSGFADLLSGQPVPADQAFASLARDAAAPALTPADAEELLMSALGGLVRQLRRREDAAARLAGRASTIADLTDRLLRARAHLDARFREATPNRAIAAHAALSEFHFLRLFKTAFGVTVGQYRQARRLEAARSRLLSSSATVTEVALEVGYASPSSFNRAFRARFGCAPTALRAKIRRMGQAAPASPG